MHALPYCLLIGSKAVHHGRNIRDRLRGVNIKRTHTQQFLPRIAETHAGYIVDFDEAAGKSVSGKTVNKDSVTDAVEEHPVIFSCIRPLWRVGRAGSLTRQNMLINRTVFLRN
jgi:hypothetical protein